MLCSAVTKQPDALFFVYVPTTFAKGRSDADLNNCVRSKHSEDTIGP